MASAIGVGRWVMFAALAAGCSTPAYRLQWVEGSDLPEAVSGHSFGWFGESGAVIGGQAIRQGKPVTIDTVRRFDPRSGAAGPLLPPLPRPLAFSACAAMGEDLLVAGGTDGELACGDAFRLTSEDGKPEWKLLPKLPATRVGPSAAVVGRAIYVIGGTGSLTDPGPADHTVYRYDFDRPDAGWVELGLAPGAGRRSAGCANAQDRIFLFGGVCEDSEGVRTAFADAYRFNPGRDEWTRLADLPEPLASPAVAPLGDRYILIVGGASVEHVRSQPADRAGEAAQPVPPYRTSAYLYDTATDMYHEVQDVPAPAIHVAAAMRDGIVFLLGGEDRPGRTLTTNRIAIVRENGVRFRR